jgi:hypothetical protein
MEAPVAGLTGSEIRLRKFRSAQLDRSAAKGLRQAPFLQPIHQQNPSENQAKKHACALPASESSYRKNSKAH